MKRPIVAYTGPLYAAVDPDDQLHRRAQRDLRRLDREGRRIILLYPTLLEAYTLILYRLGNLAASQWLQETTRGTVMINPTPADFREAQELIARLADQPITLFEATVAVMAARLSAAVWTFDHHFDILRAPVWR